MWNLNEAKQIEYMSGYSYLIIFDNDVRAVIDFEDYLQRGPGIRASSRPTVFSAGEN
jgi:hypothetical protein